MKLSHEASFAVFSALAAANPLRVTVEIEEPDVPLSKSVAARPARRVNWYSCGHASDVFHLKNHTITPDPPVP
jgi:hypothetical protein